MLFPWKKENQFRKHRIESIQNQIRLHKKIQDIEFDSLYPREIEIISVVQWTPAEVVENILEFLSLSAADKVLDVGSGVGKFCLLAGISAKAHFFGVEKRKSLYLISEKLRKEFSLKNVTFLHTDMSELNWKKYNVFYFYNPFYESLTTTNTIDDFEEKGLGKYTLDLIFVKNRLSELSPGTRVVTYHTFGGKMPSSYRLEKKISLSSGDIEFYLKMK